MRFVVWAPLALLVAPVLAACDNKDCSGVGKPAIVVTLTDSSSDATICEGNVRFTGPDTDETVTCSADAGASHPWCFGCRFELFADPLREYTIEANAPGYAPATKTVYVEGEDCNLPATETVSFALAPE